MKQSKKLLKFSDIFHGFTTKDEQWPKEGLVLAEQVHGRKIVYVGKEDMNKKIKGADGLVTNVPGVNIAVHTADCLPILFYEPVKRIVGACHAGWRGTLDLISQKAVREIESLGGEAKNLIVAVGPHVGLCCYDTDEKRAETFEEKFGPDPRMISNFSGRPHLDLAYVNFLTLLKTGVKRENMDIPPSCTSCQKDLFFSYRRSKKEGDVFGEMLAIIGMKI